MVLAPSTDAPASSPAPAEPAGPGLSVRLLGSWGLSGVPPDTRVPMTVRRLVTLLSLRGAAGREELAAAMWPEATTPHATGSLRTALWRARTVHEQLVECDGDVARLCDGVRVDVDDLALVVRQLDAGSVPEPLGAVPAHPLVGELVPGWYDDWLELERERVRQLQLHALEQLALALAGQSRFALAMEAALAAVRLEPLRESAHRAVLVVHLREGNRSEAVRHFEGYRRMLDRELAVGPSAAMLHVLEGAVVIPEPRRRDRPAPASG